MFKLPNCSKIDEEMIMMGMEDSDLANSYFFDTVTGEVAFVSEFSDTEKELEQYEDKRFIKVPQIPPREQYEWIKKFVEDIVEPENSVLAEKLSIALNGKDAFRRFKGILEQDAEGWLEAWYAWKGDCVYDELRSWLSTLPIEIIEEFDFFDDCDVCLLMKYGAPEEKILEAMKDINNFQEKAKRSN